MSLKPWKDIAREALDPAPQAAGDTAPSLLDIAAVNPELKRLLDERERLEAKMLEIASGAQGAFAPSHDQVRFPVEPLGERRARDARWAEARDESRSDRIARILETRRREAAAGTRTEAQPAPSADQTRAFDERVQRARDELLRERWTGRRSADAEDWYELRERQSAEALAAARLQTVQAAEMERALEQRRQTARARQTAEALAELRRQTREAAAREQALEERLARAREDRLRENRTAYPPASEPGVPAMARPEPSPPKRWRDDAARLHDLDTRISRARDQLGRPARSAPPVPDRDSASRAASPTRRTGPDIIQARREMAAARVQEDLSRQARAAARNARRAAIGDLAAAAAPRTGARAGKAASAVAGLDRRLEQARERLLAAGRRSRAMARAAAAAAGGVETVERVSSGLRDLDKSIKRTRQELDPQQDAALLAQLDRRDGGVGRALSIADKAEAPLRRGREGLDIFQTQRDRLRARAAEPGSYLRETVRKLGLDFGSVDALTALRDARRALGPDRRKTAGAERPRTAADRLQDLDKRAGQALQRLKARRSEEGRAARRSQRGEAPRRPSEDDLAG